MLEQVHNFDNSHPKLKSKPSTNKWSRLFLYDLALGITSRQKNEKGNTLKKFESNTSMGEKMLRNHEENVEKMLAENKETYANAFDLPSISSDAFDAKDFHNWRMKIGKPLVIKGFLQDAPILDLMSLESLIQNHGSQEVKCTALPTQNKESTVGQNLSAFDTTLEEFLTSDQYVNHYINNFFGILNARDFLELCKGNELDEIMGSPNILTQWFISRTKNSGSTMHCASADNMFLNIKGKKEWFFIDPTYTPIMQPAMSKHGVFCVSEIEETFDGDFYEELIRNYPYMQSVPVYRTVLEEGDVLFNPPWWWHRVKNLSPLTVGCATRYWEAKSSWGNSKTFSVGMYIESLKNPKKSPIYLSLKSLIKKDNAKDYIDSIFTKGDK